MELCHTITIDRTLSLEHSVRPISCFINESLTRVLVKPCKLSYSPWHIGVFCDTDTDLGEDRLLIFDVVTELRIHIVECVDNEPLLMGQSKTRSLLMLAEMLNGIAEGIETCGFQVASLQPHPQDNFLAIKFVIPAGMLPSTCTGAAASIVTVIDALLFERGLTVSSTQVVIDGLSGVGFDRLLFVLKKILTSLDDSTL